MQAPMPVKLGAAALVVLAAGAACSPSSPSAAPEVVACDSTVATEATDSFALSDVAVTVEGTDPALAPVRADLASYLGTMWGGTVTVGSAPPNGSSMVSLWLSTSAAAQAALGTSVTNGYAMKRVDAGGQTTVLVVADDAPNLAAGAYALLERLGARFFHPKQELVPALGAPRLPHTLDVTRHPLAGRRGLQPHTLHPIEYFDVFMAPSAANLADAQRFVDWLVKTGQNYMQWPLLATVPWDTWVPYATSILSYAHSRHVQIGASVEIWSGSSDQNNYFLVSDTSQWTTEIAAGLDQLMQIPWDRVDLAMGEFSSTDPQSIIAWLDYGTDYITSNYPNVLVDVDNHVGNYPQLWVDYQGKTVFFYQLPQYCDVRLGQNVHTLSLFDSYRDWATYGHPNFHLQHDYLLQELATRRTSYYPEAAYWISADIDVPLFLPETIYSRWLDISSLAAEIQARGLPPLDGHLQFMSGHEWNYWLTDYLVAKMLWDPSASLDAIQGAYTSSFGSCAADVDAAFSSYVALQTKYLFDLRLFPYVQGENGTVDEGYLVGLETHPKRVEFEDVLAMSAAEQGAFASSVVSGLEAFAAESQPIEDAIAARCRGSDATLAPWCDELWDGVEIVRLRATHAALLYRSILAYAGGDMGQAQSLLTQATQTTSTAAQVVARREAQYRFDITRETGQYNNPTVYAFGYLREAHTQCYWLRREDQVTYLLANGAPERLSSLRSCTD